MATFGRIQNGVVVLDPGSEFPEGTRVLVSAAPAPVGQGEKRRVDFPLVRTGTPGTWNVTSERMGEILEEEDLAAMKDQWHASS